MDRYYDNVKLTDEEEVEVNPEYRRAYLKRTNKRRSIACIALKALKFVCALFVFIWLAVHSVKLVMEIVTLPSLIRMSN